MKGGLGEIDQRGAGVFGYWSEDADGRPIYVYTMDQARDPRALYNTSLGPSRDHWHQVGTGEFVATVHNGGYAQIYDWSRGGKCLNRWDPDNGHFSGGFLLVEIDGEAFSTLWEGLPEGATQERRWGCNYAERVTRFRGLEIRERIDNSHGAAHALTWRVSNQSQLEVSLRAIAPWWLNLEHITPAPLMTYGARKIVAHRRSRHARRHHLSLNYMELDATIPVRGKTIQLHLDDNRDHMYIRERAMVDREPGSYELCVINEEQTRIFAIRAEHVQRDAVRRLPVWFDEARHALAQDPRPTHPMENLGGYRGASGFVLAAARDAILQPGESVEGAVLFGGLTRACHLRNETPNSGLSRKPEISLEMLCAGTISRELRWHSSYLDGASVYSQYHDNYFVDQGSAYSYLQGLSGAPRDFALFILPMVYLNPWLAKSMLRHLLVSQRVRNGKLPYCTVGNGVQRGYVLHSFSSDLDLFLLWAASEYIGATRDLAFLAEVLPYYPKLLRKEGTVLDHLQKAFAHLRERVGLGPHGLIRCGSGDWNDVLLGFSRVPPLTFLRGESSLNAGLAALALPRLADALGDTAPEFAAELRAFGAAQAAALKTLWTGRWAARGYLGYGNKKLGEDRIFLDTQAFGVLAGVWDEAQRATLFENIDELCVRPQKVGALALWPPIKGPLLVEGSDTNGGTWAAIDGLLAWAWAQHDPQRAWEFYQSTTLAARADAYPDTWYGVWSGPDSFNAHYHARPGETFCHNFTPMMDFPIMNMNRHALPLLDAVKFAGIEPRDGVIEIRPLVPGGVFTFKSTLIDVSCDGHKIAGEYRPICDGTFHFRIAIPGARGGEAVCGHLNAEKIEATSNHEGMVALEAAADPNRPVRWSLAKSASEFRNNY